MANNILTATITADGDKFTKTLGQLQAQLRSFENGLKNAGSVESFNRLNRAIDVTKQKIASINGGFTSLTKTSTAATGSLINLGRVVQDAPFGFLGIANNLNPLLESFQRLKTTTGSTGGALKALGKDMLGAGGLGFALSIVSTGLILFGDRLFGAGKKAKEAASEADIFKKAVDGIFDSVAKEAAQVTGLVAVLKSETETRQRKLSAIKELQNIQPEVFRGLKLEGEAVVGLDDAYKNYLSSLKTVIAAKIKQLQLENLIEKQLLAEGVTLTKSEQQFQNGIDQVKEWRRQRALAAGEADPFALDDKAAQKLQSDIDALIKDLTELSSGIRVNDLTVKPKKIKIEEPRGPVQFPLKIEPEFSIEVGYVKEEIFRRFKDLRATVDIPLGLNLKPKTAPPNAALEAMRKQAAALGDAFSRALGGAFESGLQSIGEGLGNLLSGKAFGASLINVIGDLITQLGKALIQYGAIKQGLDKILGPGGFAIPGGVAIGLGVAAIAIGQAFKNFGGFRAAGGPVGAGQGYIVGEKGPEWFQPNTGGRIIPNDQLGGMASSNSGGGMYTFKIKGNDLVAVLSSVNQYQFRNR
jgi:hypothetical protein